MKDNNNNVITLTGTILSAAEFGHEISGEDFYNVFVSIPRMSEIADVLKVTMSGRIIKVNDLLIGCNVEIDGQIRTYNRKDETGKSKLNVTVFANAINILDDSDVAFDNEAKLTGYICKKPVKRRTPFGRDVCDLILAVNRSYGRSDYVPCICWGRNAKFVSELEIGSKITCEGRLQSRQYNKTVDDKVETRIAYELSVKTVTKELFSMDGIMEEIKQID